ncbi:MAG: hypothetical protein J6Z34_00465 [Clostridia bacterium]|nr:hypothetical protein [Clostridia bacterium]
MEIDKLIKEFNEMSYQTCKRTITEDEENYLTRIYKNILTAMKYDNKYGKNYNIETKYINNELLQIEKVKAKK